jgi:putative aldouronate transport system substrate-binding protein
MDIWQRYYWYGDNYGEYLDDYNYQCFWVQKDVLADAGYPQPEEINELDELFDMLEAYYAKYPTIDGMPTLPFEIQSTDPEKRFCLINPPQHLIGGGNDGDAFVEQDTYTAEIYQNKWYAKDYYKKLNEVFKKGLINPETFTLTNEDYLQRIAQGRVLAIFDAQWNFEKQEAALVAEGRYERTYVPLPITYDGYEQGYMDIPAFVGGNGLGITINCKDVDRVMEYMETLLNEDLQRLMSWGIEGEDYYMTEDGRYRLTPEQKINWDNDDWRNENSGHPLRDRFPKIEGMFSDGNAATSGTQPEIRAENASASDKDFFSHYPFDMKSGFLKPVERADYYPIWGYSIRRGTDARIAWDEVKDTASRYLPGVIMADDFESAWAEYVARYDNINYAAYEEELNRQIAERMGLDR